METPENTVENLKFLTESTFKELIKLEIVTPSIYRNTFVGIAQRHTITFDNEEEVYSEFLTEKFNKYQKGVVDTVEKLRSGIQVAKKAIQDKDEKALEQIEKKIEILDQYIQTLENEIYTDQLTETYNRKWIFDKFLHEERFRFNGVMIFIDLNKFKVINDNYGHVVGDRVLKTISLILKSIKNSVCMRYAGDEFIVSFKDLEEKAANKIIHELRTKLDKKVINIENHTFKVDFSYGIAEFKKDELFSEALEIADKKMYEDKGSKK